MKKPKEDYASAIMSTKQATDACISDVARLFSTTGYKKLVVESLTVNNPFKKILPKKILKSIETDINNMAFTRYDKHVDGIYYDEHCTPKKDVTIQDIIKLMCEHIGTRSLVHQHEISGWLDDDAKYLFIAKRVARTVVAKIMFSSDYSKMFNDMIPNISEVYLSNGYTFDKKVKIIYRTSSKAKSPIRIIRTPQGSIDLGDLQVAVATLLNICHYSVSLRPIGYKVLQTANAVPYTDRVLMFKDSIIDTISTTTDATLVLRRKGDTFISVKYLKEIYSLLVKDSFTNDKGKTYPLKNFIEDLDMFGTPALKKVNGSPIKMRLIRKSND